MILLLACAPKAPEAPPPAGHVQATVEAPPGAERTAILRVLAGADVSGCYEAALARDRTAAGEVVVRFSLDGGGLVVASEPSLTTLDDEAARCVAGVVRTLQFPPPSRAGLTVLYPFVFTSNATPPEVARALKLRYGLAEEDLDQQVAAPDAKVPEGVVITW